MSQTPAHGSEKPLPHEQEATDVQQRARHEGDGQDDRGQCANDLDEAEDLVELRLEETDMGVDEAHERLAGLAELPEKRRRPLSGAVQARLSRRPIVRVRHAAQAARKPWPLMRAAVSKNPYVRR